MASAEPSRFQRVLFGIVLVAQLCLTIWLSATLNIRFDEAYSLHTTSHGLAYAIHQAIAWELQPPLYFALLEIWRHLGGSIFVARLLSVLAAALGVYVCGGLAKQWLPSGARLWFVAAIAFNPFVIASAVDARVYAFVFLWSVLMLRLFWQGYLRETPSAHARVLLTIVSIAALYTQYYLTFLLVGFMCALILARSWRLSAVFVAWSGAVAAAALPLALDLRSQVQTNAANYGSHADFTGNAVSFIRILITDIIPLNWSSGLTLTFVTGLICAFLVLLILTSDRGELARWCAAPLAILVGGGLAFVTAVTVARAEVTSHYVSAFHAVAFIALFGVLAAGISRVRHGRLVLTASLLLISSVVSLAAEYRHLAKPGDAKRVAQFIAAQEAPGERIAVFDAQNALPLAYHYAGVNKIVPIPRPVRFDRFLLSDIAINDSTEVATALGYRPGVREKVWLVTADASLEEAELRPYLLDDFVDRHYIALSDRCFYGARVRLLEER